MPGAITGVLEESYGASGVVTANRFCKQTGDQTVIRCDTQGETAVGVAKSDISSAEATAGKLTAVQALGIAWVEAGATINRGDDVMTDNVGRAITGTSTNSNLGKCRKGAAVGALCLVELKGQPHFLKP